MSSVHAKTPLSVFIISLDEEDRIGRTIDSVIDWVDEVIVVDSGSKDRTVEIAEAKGAKVFHNPWAGYGRQKRFAEDCCTNTWLLNLDADEVLTPELAEEIRFHFNPLPELDVYRVHIADVFPHEESPKRWAYGYWQYRLYDRTKGRFSESPVHDTVRPLKEAKIGSLKGKVSHYSQRSIHWVVEKMNRYSDMQVRDLMQRGRHIHPLRLSYEYGLSFFKSYFLRRGFLYGWWGLINARNYAFSRHLRLAKLYEYELLIKAGKRERPSIKG
ncbi:glycosyltransferase family 2 protein [Rhodobacteraceae bacterium RKSG542]|uniref:glycosyltransferase family 2 protein n=1 Tax=Pseudovibrio flavus TaxID=2529854 RepID=UPI0012BB6DE2|nr:glycosyltransferase family 2 protein [Pseudovibrio flavus]MTI16494.1 glycosyltransferase family 2 protein [Pseudovibrio flavus]